MISSAEDIDRSNPDVPSSPPLVELRSRLGDARSEYEAADRALDRLGNVRLVLAGVAVALLVMPLYARSGTPWWGLIPVAIGFIGLGKLQDRWLTRRRWSGASSQYFEGAVARLEEDWRDAQGSVVDEGRDVGKPWMGSLHPADDLDLFGSASLFQLLCRAVTAPGRRTLARWLAEPATPSEAQARQSAVVPLAADLSLRQRLYAAAAADDFEVLGDAALLHWAEKSRPLPWSTGLAVLGVVFPVLFFAAAAWAFLAGGPREPFYVITLAQIGFLFWTRRWSSERANVLSGPERTLSRYARLIDVVESIPSGQSPRLDELKSRLSGTGHPASQELRDLERLVEMLDARMNMFFALTLGPALLWELNIVLRSEGWRRRVGGRLRAWLETLGEVEALASFAALRYERPDYVFPEWVEDSHRFEAEKLSHPLIDRRRVVANDLKLGGAGSVLILSGSNMSGKSTLLRSVGLAVILARSGAPVPARRLVLSSVRLVTSVRIVDSLAEGASHFYAELRRLKHVLDEAKGNGPPLLYLLDEVLSGTNSRERFLGAVSIIKWLSESGAYGIVTTHDLELAQVARVLPAGRVVDAHFSDDVDGDALHFDYQLRPGPIQSTNALRLMRAVGIDVELVEP